jgi:SET domain-containing protein
VGSNPTPRTFIFSYEKMFIKEKKLTTSANDRFIISNIPLKFMQNIVVKKSSINGKGVFTKRNIKKGEIVIRWDTSHQLTATEAKKLKNKKYLARVGRKYFLMQPPAKFVNHSCEANTFVKNYCDVAKRNILKDEEITSDYSKDSSVDISMICTCKSKNCRKIIKRCH